jgi:uncharacterized protein (TIGR02246 family)
LERKDKVERSIVSDVAQIYELWKAYAEAVTAGDFQRWIALWTDEGIRLSPPDLGPRQVGKKEIRAVVQPLFDSSTLTAAINTEGVQILGGQAYSHGTYVITVTPKEGGDTMTLKGNFLTIFAKQADGSWRIAIDCFNS